MHLLDSKRLPVTTVQEHVGYIIVSDFHGSEIPFQLLVAPDCSISYMGDAIRKNCVINIHVRILVSSDKICKFYKMPSPVTVQAKTLFRKINS